jgi:LAO/AO transport system kinase
LLVINKADIDPEAAERTQHHFAGALSMLRSMSAHWRPPVLLVSALAGTGIDRFWAEIQRFRDTMTDSGELEGKRCSTAACATAFSTTRRYGRTWKQLAPPSATAR